MSIGSEIKRVRLALLMDQTSFGEAVGASFTSVNRWENDRGKPSLKYLRAISALCAEQGIAFDTSKATEVNELG